MIRLAATLTLLVSFLALIGCQAAGQEPASPTESAVTTAPAASPAPTESAEPSGPPDPTATPPRPETTTRCNTLNIAHRGAGSLAPENTMAAAQRAFELGADMWELDVVMSQDGVLFLLHDDTLERTSDAATRFPDRKPWAAHKFDWEEIQQLDFGSWYNREDPFGQIAEGHVSQAEQERFVGEQAPTLEEALRFVQEKGWRVNVELKNLGGTQGDAVIVEETVALIEQLGMEEMVLISSFNHRYLERVKQANPAIATAALVGRPLRDPLALIERIDAQAYNPRSSAIRPEEIATLRNAGIDVYIWTVNEEEEMRRLVEHGASGIITDFPQRLEAILEACRASEASE